MPIAAYPPNEICEQCREVGIEIGKVAVHLCPRHRDQPEASGRGKAAIDKLIGVPQGNQPPTTIWIEWPDKGDRRYFYAGHPDVAEQYILRSTHDAEVARLRETLGNVGRPQWTRKGSQLVRCWCFGSSCTNEPRCAAARALLGKGEGE